MNEEVRELIYTIGSAVTLTGGFWYLEAPQGDNLPYAVFSPLTSTRSGDTKSKISNIPFQINIYGSSVSQVEALAKSFEEIFDNRINEDLTSYRIIDCSMTLSLGTTKLVESYFQFTQEYELTIEHK